jgi:hypothetical protein
MFLKPIYNTRSECLLVIFGKHGNDHKDKSIVLEDITPYNLVYHFQRSPNR